MSFKFCTLVNAKDVRPGHSIIMRHKLCLIIGRDVELTVDNKISFMILYDGQIRPLKMPFACNMFVIKDD